MPSRGRKAGQRSTPSEHEERKAHETSLAESELSLRPLKSGNQNVFLVLMSGFFVFFCLPDHVHFENLKGVLESESPNNLSQLCPTIRAQNSVSLRIWSSRHSYTMVCWEPIFGSSTRTMYGFNHCGASPASHPGTGRFVCSQLIHQKQLVN